MASIASVIVYTLLGFIAVWLLLIFVVLKPAEDAIVSPPSFADSITEVGSPSARIVDNVPLPIARQQKYNVKTKTLAIPVATKVPITTNKAHQAIPISSEWLFINSVNNYGKPPSKTENREIVKPVSKEKQAIKIEVKQPKSANPALQKQLDPMPGKPAHELSWPAMLPDGSIAAADGFDVMPMINIKVPRFFMPKEGEDLNKVGSKVNGEETIFLMIASYRDFQCRETITSAYMRADHPERLFIGAVDQLVPGDIGCLDIDIPCSQDPTQMICKYRDQISIYKMDAQYATGPVTARHVGDRMYRGEYFVMQMDAHCQFVRHWDKLLIDQWRSTRNEMAVLSSYLTDVQGSFTPEGDSTRNTRPIMCNSDYEGGKAARYLRHGSQPEDYPVIRDMPQLEPFWAAGFSFSRGHFKLRVPYDAYQPMVFQGEEIAIGIRGFTHGYDFYAPRDSVVFHEYASMSKRRKKVHMFWENSGHAGMEQNSLKRGTAVIGMAPDLDPSAWDHSELDRYGLGKVRDVQLFYKLFLINVRTQKATPLCPFVNSGIMHRDFQPYLRADGLGIDYTYIKEYDTGDTLIHRPRRDQPYWIRQIEKGLTEQNIVQLQRAVTAAQQMGLYNTKPDLRARADKFLSKQQQH